MSVIQKAERALSTWFYDLDERIEKFVDTVRTDPKERLFANMNKDREHTFYRVAMPPVGPTCSIKWYGEPFADVSKPYCKAAKIKIDDHGCDLFSLGSNNQWGTETAMHAATPCRIHTFDCTSRDSMPRGIRDRTKFYNVCISSKDETIEGRRYVTWPSVLKLTGVTMAAPKYLKMDIEGYEYGVLRSILHSGESHLLPEQLAMEIHTFTSHRVGAGALAWADKREKGGGELMAFILMLYNAGYRLTFVDWRTVCPWCIEVLFARIFC